MRHVNTQAVKLPIAFPALLCEIILSQHPRILLSTDMIAKRESTISFHFKLFTGKHVPDIGITFVPNVNMTSTKERMISKLMNACKDLDEVIRVSLARKLDFEQMIKDLKQANDAHAEASSEEGDFENKEDHSKAAETIESKDS